MTDNFKISKSEFIFLGTPVAKYEFSNEHLILLNNIIDEKLKNKSLKKHSDSLAGELENEYFILDSLTHPILELFYVYIRNYLNRLQIKFYHFNIISCWFNEQKENEYNPLHVHHGKNTNIGISSVLYLKVPKCIKEAKPKNKKEVAKDGRLEFVSNNSSYLTKTTYLVHPQEGDFYLFPYNLNHCVYPFKGEGIRRSLSFNIDLFL
jgi:hypothetical protein